MSILNDDRRYSDNEEEYQDWQREVEREYRGDDYEPDYIDELRDQIVESGYIYHPPGRKGVK